VPLPSWVMLQVSDVQDSKTTNFRHLELSLKGSERQRPSVLQQALRFNSILNEADKPIIEPNLQALIDEWNCQPFIIAQKRWAISKDTRISIINLCVAVSKPALDVMTAHLNWAKWSESCAGLARIMRAVAVASHEVRF